MARRLVKPHPYPGIGAKIREARQAAGLSAAELGQLVGGSNKGLVSLWERERNCPSEAKMALIEKALGIELPRAVRNAEGRRSDGERACLTCGKTFTGFYRQKYCSSACWYATMPPKKRACPSCEKEFEPGTPGQRYCSRTCSGYGQRNKNRPTECEWCHGSMPDTAHARQRYCSRLCARRARLGREELHEIGDKRPSTAGYIEVKTAEGWKLEHRVMMEAHLGHPLLPGENVHHKNRVKTDNRIDNFELWYTPQPAGGRVNDLIERVVDKAKLDGFTGEQQAKIRGWLEEEHIKPADPEPEPVAEVTDFMLPSAEIEERLAALPDLFSVLAD